MNLEFSLSDGTVHTSLQVIEKNFYKNIEAEIKGALMQIWKFRNMFGFI